MSTQVWVGLVTVPLFLGSPIENLISRSHDKHLGLHSPQLTMRLLVMPPQDTILKLDSARRSPRGAMVRELFLGGTLSIGGGTAV